MKKIINYVNFLKAMEILGILSAGAGLAMILEYGYEPLFIGIVALGVINKVAYRLLRYWNAQQQ